MESKDSLLKLLVDILLFIKNEINIPDIQIFVFLDEDYNLVVNVSLLIMKEYAYRHVFSREVINCDIYNLELKFFCRSCNQMFNKKKEELRKFIKEELRNGIIVK